MKAFLNKLIKSFVRLAKLSFIRLCYLFVPIDRKRILFDHFAGLDVGCNPGQIAREIHARYPDLQIHWLLNHKYIGANSHWLTYAQTNFFSKTLAVASAKVVVINTLNSMRHWPKRKDQIWIQTGHGSFGIKRVGLDVSSNRAAMIKKEATKTDFFLSNSTFESTVFNSAFCFQPSQIVEIGHARNDIFFNERWDCQAARSIRDTYGIADRKLFLIAPTRGEQAVDMVKSIDIDRLLTTLEQRFGGDWIVGVKLHAHTRNFVARKGTEFEVYDHPSVLNLSECPDMSHLLAAADAMVTDFSSCIFDFLLTRRPAFFYVSEANLEDIRRELYFDFEETPISLSKDFSALCDNISGFDSSGYIKNVDEFLRNAGSCEDGHAGERAADLINAKICGLSAEHIVFDRDAQQKADVFQDA